MQLARTSRPARLRRMLAVSAAAVFVVIAPTACDSGSYGGASAPAGGGTDAGHGGGTSHSGHSATVDGTARQPVVVVPVGNSVESPEVTDPEAVGVGVDPAADPVAADTADSAADVAGGAVAADSDRRRGRDGQGRGGQGSPTTTTVPTASDTAVPTAGPPPAVAPSPGVTASPTPPATTTPATTTPTPAPAPADQPLGNDCSNSRLAPHTGFQEAPRCVGTAFGEVAAAANSPSLLITDAPRTVRANTAFDLVVSTRNLIRDRFLAAGTGGYYKESSFLDARGIQRGHFHTACRMLSTLRSAPDAAPVPAFFVATQDNGGGTAPDSVRVKVSGLPRGIAQCAVWAGDGSHRVPMMERANQTPAFDVVRILVR